MKLISLTLFIAIHICAAYNPDFVYIDELSYTDDKHDKFDWMLTKVILNDECVDCNIITSPYTVKLLLSLLDKSIAENSKSKNELSILFSNLRKYEEHDYWNSTLQSLNEKKDNYSVSVVSQLCIDKSARVENYYRKLAKNIYNTDVKTLDLVHNSINASKILNEFVFNKTEGNVKDIVTPENLEGITAIILSVIYFKADWEDPFVLTFNRTFSVTRDIKVPATFMIHEDRNFYYGESKKLKSEIVRLNYKGGKYAMNIILPNEIDGLQYVIDNLDVEVIRSEQSKMKKLYMDVILPKFKFESTLSLKNQIKKLGINQIFTSNSDIKAIKSTLPLKVTDIIQKMGIVTNERGTVAYGAIEAYITQKMGPTRVFRANHPFLFFIEDETTGSILFVGKVSKPTYD